MNAVVIAGTGSGVGKTTVALGLMRALRKRGLRVQPFKVGPDFIDPGFHSLICGLPSRNLDGWMMPPSSVQETFSRHMKRADIGVIEGVMGLFDGVDGRSEDGSTAQLAKWLGIPVVLVVDARAMARSGAALAYGFERFDPELVLRGIIFNRVGSTRHFEYLREAVAEKCRAEVLGFLRRRDELVLPERYLGLVTARESPPSSDFVEVLGEEVESCLSVDRIISISGSGRCPETGDDAGPEQSADRPLSGVPKGVRLAVAWDEAFCFYYQDNLDLLSEMGVRICRFSPLRDSSLPEDIDGIYLGGGYPELYAATLAANEPMRLMIRNAAREGMPIYAECGGMMYLTRAIHDIHGHAYPMAGVLPTEARMLPRRKALGYVEVRLKRDCPVGQSGAVLRGHEYHYSELVDDPLERGVDAAYELSRRKDGPIRKEGYYQEPVLASYVHLHFGSNPGAAAQFASWLRTRRLRLERSFKQ